MNVKTEIFCPSEAQRQNGFPDGFKKRRAKFFQKRKSPRAQYVNPHRAAAGCSIIALRLPLAAKKEPACNGTDRQFTPEEHGADATTAFPDKSPFSLSASGAVLSHKSCLSQKGSGRKRRGHGKERKNSGEN